MVSSQVHPQASVVNKFPHEVRGRENGTKKMRNGKSKTLEQIREAVVIDLQLSSRTKAKACMSRDRCIFLKFRFRTVAMGGGACKPWVVWLVWGFDHRLLSRATCVMWLYIILILSTVLISLTRWANLERAVEHNRQSGIDLCYCQFHGLEVQSSDTGLSVVMWLYAPLHGLSRPRLLLTFLIK